MAVYSWTSVLSAFTMIAVLPVVSPSECIWQFSVEVDGQRLFVNTVCVTTLGLGLREELQPPSEYSRVGVRPLIDVSTCSHTVDDSGIINTTHYTLLAVAQSTEPNTNCNHDHGCMWALDLPGYFTDVHCIDIHIKGSPIGPTPHIHELRFGTENLTPFALNAQSEREVWVEPLGQAISELLCPSHGEELCEVLDTSSYDQVSTIALMRNGTQYYIEYLNSGHVAFLPNCLTNTTSHVTPQWVLLCDTACGEENRVSFTPRRVYTASLNELYITGDGGMLYSPNKGITFYQLLLPSSMETISSFTLSSDRTYACTTTGNGTSGVWLGFAGSSELVQLYPSTLLDKLWEVSGTQWNDSTLQNSTVEFNSQNELCLIEGPNTVTFPLPLLVSSAAYETNITELDSLDLHNLLTISQDSHLVTNMDHSHCPFVAVVTEAPVCSVITRSRLEIISSGVLRWIDENTLPQKNCRISSNDLPKHIFLGKSESYRFVVHFIQDPHLYGPDGLYYTAHSSSPEVLGVEMARSYHHTNNSLTYHVTLQEKNQFAGQFSSGYIASSVDVNLEVWGANHVCVQPTSGTELKIPGRLNTRVHVGCPPGLSLVFDAKTTGRKYNQYCKPDNNISCYYFNNEFHPVFELVDSVIGEKTIYTGSYTLTAIAGGTRLGHMKSFNRNKNIESEIWTPVKKAYSYTDNKIQWVCGTASPCGDIVPHSGNIPEYFLQMEASNLFVAADETYCNLTVHFTIRIHGMGMGSVTLIVTLTCLLVVMLVVTLLLFGMWHFRLRLLYFRDRTIEYWESKFYSTRRVVMEYIRRHKTRVHPTKSS